jgi:hypothetical protein
MKIAGAKFRLGNRGTKYRVFAVADDEPVRGAPQGRRLNHLRPHRRRRHARGRLGSHRPQGDGTAADMGRVRVCRGEVRPGRWGWEAADAVAVVLGGGGGGGGDAGGHGGAKFGGLQGSFCNFEVWWWWNV